MDRRDYLGQYAINERGELYGPGYTFIIGGDEYTGYFDVELATMETGEVLVLVTSSDNIHELLYQDIAPDFAAGARAALGFLMGMPNAVIEKSNQVSSFGV